MANLTITVEDDLLKQARVRAAQQGTSVNAVLRDYLERYAGLRARRDEAARSLLALAEAAGSSHTGERWTRDSLYER